MNVYKESIKSIKSKCAFSNSFEQLTAWDDVKETVNGEKYNDNSWHDSTRALIHTDINLNDKFNNCILIYYSPSPEFNTNYKNLMQILSTQWP